MNLRVLTHPIKSQIGSQDKGPFKGHVKGQVKGQVKGGNGSVASTPASTLVTVDSGGSVGAAAAVEGVGATSGAVGVHIHQPYGTPELTNLGDQVQQKPLYYNYTTNVPPATAQTFLHWPTPGPFRHVAEKEAVQLYGFPNDSYAQWVAISIVLASFGQIIDSTGDRPKIGTFMASIGIFVLIWSTPMFFIPRFGVLNPWALTGLLLIVLLLLCAYIWIIVRIWDP
jgi:hypothetical protein